jgi:polyisoprenoid-binding protein YceI
MSTPKHRKLFVAIAAVGVVLLAAGGFVAWQVFGGSEPPAAALSSAAASGSPATVGGADGFDGTWTIDSTSGSLGDGTATFAGYRINEELAGFGTNTAVGRTQDVTGSMTVDGTTVSALEVTVDMTTLRSDDDRRDGQLSDRGLQTSQFPTATFTLTDPVDVDSIPKTGQKIQATATGQLTLHGVTKDVEVPIEAQWNGERFEVVASFDVTLADYGIEAPTGFSVLSVADTGTVELHVLFQPGT